MTEAQRKLVIAFLEKSTYEFIEDKVTFNMQEDGGLTPEQEREVRKRIAEDNFSGEDFPPDRDYPKWILEAWLARSLVKEQRTMTIRKPLLDFVEAMERRLKAKDINKGEHGWLGAHPLWLLARAEEELKELKEELMRPSSTDAIIREATDVANFCMMIADNIVPKK